MSLVHQRGAAALGVTLLLALLLALGALALQRTIAVEQRQAEQQVQAARAFEAAEAGLAWAQARLNDPRGIDASCQPSTDPGALPFRTRMLTWSDPAGLLGLNGGATAQCAQDASGWTCRCSSGTSSSNAVAASGPAFSLEFQAVALSGQVRVLAHGCDRPGQECGAASAGPAGAATTTFVDLGLVPGLRTAPASALMVRDATRQSEDQFFAASFGLDPGHWHAQPMVVHVGCSASDCGDAIAKAISAGADLISADGDVHLAGPRTLGSGERPIVLVARGSLRLDGPVAFVGALHAASIVIGQPGATVRGALFTAGSYAGPAAPDVQLDTSVLAILRHRTGSFARVSGSWRDF